MNKGINKGTKNSGRTVPRVDREVNSGVLRHNAGLMKILHSLFVGVSMLMTGASMFACADDSPSQVMNKPQRIVSMGLCADQLLLMMVDRERIASVTYAASQTESSYMAAAVNDIPLNHTGAEEIISFKPDLVVGSTYAAQDTAHLLSELGYNVKLSTPPRTLTQVRELILEFGEWTGSQQKARQLVADMDARLQDIHKRYDHKPQRTIMVYSPNGYTIGNDTLENEIFKEAGYRNLSAEMGVHGFQTISMEQLVATQPDFLQIDNYIYNQNSLASSYINHPVLKDVVSAEKRLYIPTTLRDCAGPMVVDAIEYLASRR
jgi:iron complex transport system substrate-binding protein